MSRLVLLFVAVALHAGVSTLVYTVWGFPLFAAYIGLVTGALAWENRELRP